MLDGEIEPFTPVSARCENTCISVTGEIIQLKIVKQTKH